MTAMARILCVYDEGSVVDTPLIGAKGFSMLIESGGKRVLFDTGLRDRYLSHNLEYLEIDPDSIDAVVVSQSHPDNCRAINALLDQRSEPVDVYAPSGLYAGKKGVLSKSAGLSDENRAKARLHNLEGWFEVAPDGAAGPATAPAPSWTPSGRGSAGMRSRSWGRSSWRRGRSPSRRPTRRSWTHADAPTSI